MAKDMASAYNPKLEGEVKRLTGTGIKLTVTEKDTGKKVNYGVQLNNTTLEIEALPNLTVDINGYKEMYEALKIYIAHQEGKRGHYCSECHNKIEKALAQAEGR